MSGIAIVGELLRTHGPLTSVVALENIRAGQLADNAPLPSVLLRTVSGTDWRKLKRGPSNRTVERISVTIRAASYREKEAILKLIRTAASGRIGNFGAALNASVLTAGKGPDLIGPGNTFEGSQDFRVSFDEPT